MLRRREGLDALDLAAWARAWRSEQAAARLTAAEISAVSFIQRAGVELLRVHPDVPPSELAALEPATSGVAGLNDSRWPTPSGWRYGESALTLHAQWHNPAARVFPGLFGQQDEQDILEGRSQALGATAPRAIDLLMAPSRAHPDSLADQVKWIMRHWSPWLSETLKRDGLFARDLLAEGFRPRGPVGGPPPPPPDASGMWSALRHMSPDEDVARFSQERTWMSELILVAKHTFVWLDQLSRRFGRPIERLDQIPTEALQELVDRGIRGLWLIGLWERSNASRDIKRRRGNPEAEASAYALYDYAIAGRLGGEEALKVLRARANQVGLRLAADMVPNHVGMDGRWVIDHPERFVQVSHPPFEGYRFDGPNLSHNPRVGIYLENGYWDGSDAAVVFKRVDHHTGDTRYLYHGNDGTQMPWNDTAQLDFLREDVREAVIQTILDVARRFPVIRFDAAMTLAKKHIERLWYPAPGNAGAIPSRAQNSVSPAEFAQRLPKEFWQEVVQRVQQEVPDTLLLAEAFWMMEGYFVRNLGMHRVYNSAFMHMTRDEDNHGYRRIIKETIAFNPEILQRFVNFMNNPDEDTAIEQFGRGDKYFGVATLMATMPGLPMFGHGQFEGYAEKYGMEYARAYWDETPDLGLLAHHHRMITPLLRQRHLFSGVRDFAIYDLHGDHHHVHQSVFAYTNATRDGSGRSLVLFNNGYTRVSGRLHRSAPTNLGSEDAPHHHTRTIAEALGVETRRPCWLAMRRADREAWQLVDGASLREGGLNVQLNGYETRVYVDFVVMTEAYDAWSAYVAEHGSLVEGPLHEALTTPPPEQDAGRPYPSRCAGLLLHPSSLPGPEGIGTLGASAYAMLDWLERAGVRVWQVLPLCPGGGGRSPYSSDASLMGDPLLIDLTDLTEAGLLTEEELATTAAVAASRVDFDTVEACKLPLLRTAARRLLDDSSHPWTEALQRFLETETWVHDAVLYRWLKREHEGKPWFEWPAPLRDREEDALQQLREEQGEALEEESVLAFFFDHQWLRLQEAAAARGVTMLGDLPIYVAHDSADVWASRDFFELTPEGRCARVAGVPPDAFSETGQLWGNPLYDWEALQEDGYQWWVQRLRRMTELTPMTRIDHFRGFAGYYAVDGDATHAMDGVWEPGPGLALFEAIDEALGVRAFVAEDLGIITEDVDQLREDTGMLGMRVLQFGVASAERNVHHPDAIGEDAVVYTGTHDNDTTVGWWHALTQAEQDLTVERLACTRQAHDVCRAMIRTALTSEAHVAVIPAQDVLMLDTEHRMNVPGEPSGNWAWRLEEPMPGDLADWLREQLDASQRTQ